MRLLIAAAVAACLFVVPAAANAHFIPRSQANGIAQNYQNGECGFATLWVCRSSHYIDQYCYTTAGYHTWYCEGWFSENDLIGGGSRICDLQVHVYSDPPQISYHWDSCRH